LAVVCPITGQAKGYPFEVALPAGLTTRGVVLSDHIKNLDWRVRKAEFREKVPEALVREVLDMATALLDPSDQPEETGGSP
jgi:mRNA interferase MazF